MNSEVRDASAVRRKAAILQYAQGIGNVKEACRDFNVPRSSFYRWKKAYAKVEPWRFHDIRHAWATRLVECGVDPYTLMELGGWSKLEMVTRYLHTSRERKRAAIEALENYSE